MLSRERHTQLRIRDRRREALVASIIIFPRWMRPRKLPAEITLVTAPAEQGATTIYDWLTRSIFAAMMKSLSVRPSTL